MWRSLWTRWRWPLLLLTAAAFAVIILVVALTSIVNRERAIALKLKCNGQLCVLGLAMQRYHEKYGHFPPAYVADEQGRPMHSWRVLLLEFLDSSLFQAYNFSEPWSSSDNIRLACCTPWFYNCPASSGFERPGMTSYVVLVGENTLFHGTQVTTLSDLTKAPNDVVLIAEVIDSNILWIEPREYSIDSFDEDLHTTSPCIGSRHPYGSLFCMVDGSRVSLEPTADELRRMATAKNPIGLSRK